MPKHQHIFQRKGVCYYRRHVPIDIREAYGKADIIKSLRTKDFNVATKLANIEDVKYDEEFETYRVPTSSGVIEIAANEVSIKQACDARFRDIIETDFTYRADIFAKAEANPEDFYGKKIIPLPKTERFYDLIEDGTTALDRILAYVFMHDLQNRIERTETALASGNYQVNGNPKLARGLLQAEIEAIEKLLSRDFSDIEPEIGSSIKAPVDDTPLFSIETAKFIEERVKLGMPEKTVAEREAAFRDFISVCGDKPISAYLKSDGVKFKEVLSKTPTHRNVKKEFRGLTITQAATQAVKMSDVKLLSSKSVNGFFNILTSFFTWANIHNDEAIANPVFGLNVKDAKSVRNKREPFSVDELKKIFQAPIYTGCQSAQKWGASGNIILKKNARYWVPLIGLFSGMRLGEIMQLTRDDICETAGITYFSINEDQDWKTLKTAVSERNIPIHPELIRLGILDFIATKSERLFDDYNQANSGSWSDSFSKHFRRFVKRIGVAGSFHRFRHSFEDCCRDSGIPGDVMDALQGHTQQGMRSTYGSGHGVKILNAAMKRISYDGLDLRHL